MCNDQTNTALASRSRVERHPLDTEKEHSYTRLYNLGLERSTQPPTKPLSLILSLTEGSKSPPCHLSDPRKRKSMDSVKYCPLGTPTSHCPLGTPTSHSRVAHRAAIHRKHSQVSYLHLPGLLPEEDTPQGRQAPCQLTVKRHHTHHSSPSSQELRSC